MTSRRSQYKGVAWSAVSSKWRAYIHVNGKQRHVGLFESEVDAARARDAAAQAEFGHLADVNFAQKPSSTRPAFCDRRLPPRFWRFVHAEPMTGCWLWAGTGNDRGYGRFGISYRMEYAHRVAFAALVGPIPETMEIDHLCMTRRCVNPEHLRLATREQNCANQGARQGTSRFKGVSLHAPSGKWLAQVKIGGTQHRLGRYETEEGAAQAYDSFVQERLKGFARTNKMLGLL